MVIERFDFVNSLLDCILFECADHYSQNGLDTPDGLIEHIDFCNENGSNTIFPMDIAVWREKRSHGRRLYAILYDDSGDEECYGGGFPEEFEGVQFVPLQQLLGHEVEQFLFDYAVLVPRAYHNDIAILI
ncbi:hypothetical protein BGZ95_007760 [Linnemannia exigua]|uniref:Uncharacterized protein n=1 Tax=Linnemannia exigua TaxID=604196 RepID=A0AAD4DFB7_9FUNG|nr:hypothetical protein BGZ95_007760 [Linnemannia exigua]